jgi:hypothetical protein
MSSHRTGAAYIEPDGGEDDTPGVHDATEQRDQASSERQQAASKSHEKLYSKLNTKRIWQDARYPVCQLHLSKYTRLLNKI